VSVQACRPRVAIVADLAEERWHSMNLVAEILMLGLRTPSARLVDATQIRPSMVRRLTRVPGLGRLSQAETADRIINRVWDYRRALCAHADDFDLFHIVDHSYAHLVTVLPPGRSLVMCHDVDAFAGVLPGTEGQSMIGRLLGERLLAGLVVARKIVCGSHATRNALLASGIVDAARLVVVPYGLHPSCTPRPDPRADDVACGYLGAPDVACPEILHVGSTVRRKRIDVLLKIVSALRTRYPSLRLIRVGGEFTPEQRRLVARLGLEPRVTVLPFLERRVLAAVYRRAAVVLQPSDREGFGLPVAEAMACGTPVVASDLEPLREVGGEVASYCPVGDVRAWTETVSSLLDERLSDGAGWAARRAAAVADARRFDVVEHARQMLAVYRELLPALADSDLTEELACVGGVGNVVSR
jgi:glycosyltransferase involved in cell wall biosynthesis